MKYLRKRECGKLPGGFILIKAGRTKTTMDSGVAYSRSRTR